MIMAHFHPENTQTDTCLTGHVFVYCEVKKMRRGTTPKHTFTTDIDLSAAEVLYITYQQDGETILEKSKEDITVSPDKLEVELTQEETLAFEEYNDVRVQIRARFGDGSAVASNIMEAPAYEILKEGVI